MPKIKVILEVEKEFETSTKFSEIEEELRRMGWKVRSLAWKVKIHENASEKD